jgi:hypothetical protein
VPTAIPLVVVTLFLCLFSCLLECRILPRSANVLMGKKMGKSVPDGEVEWLRNLVDKRKAMVEAREKALSSKLVFNRKVAAAIGGETKGQVSLDQVCDEPKP